jgi:uncharacterized membrane protein YtjA (UPF0391 family)
MLRWTVAFFIISVVAAFFGFSGVSAATAEIAQIIFYLFLFVFVLSLLGGFIRGRKTKDII